MGDLLSGAEFAALARIPVFIGGPVSQEKLTFAAMTWDAEAQKLNFTTHLSVSDATRHHLEGEAVSAFVGYSGWSEGQLENELRQHAWITRKWRRACHRAAPARCALGVAAHVDGAVFRPAGRDAEDPSLN